MIRVAIIGVGRQGSKYAEYFFHNMFSDTELIALCDTNSERFIALDPQNKYNHVVDYRDLLRNYQLDAIIIDTPHYLHPIIALEAVKQGISVLSDKPLGVDAYTVRKLMPELKKHAVTFGVLFNQRMLPIYRRIKELLDQRQLGSLKRCVWEVTDWYRPQKYYDIGGWRGTWKGEGGGVLINQCVHNIDMICCFFGLPRKVQSLIGYGAYHKTEVDDSVIANLIYDNEFVCTLISSTGETPGTNRLEIVGTKGKLVFDEFSILKLFMNDIPENVFSAYASSPRYKLSFSKPNTTYHEEKFDAHMDMHLLCIKDFLQAVQMKTEPSASYQDGLSCVEVINAIYCSDWVGRSVDFPVNEKAFRSLLMQKAGATKE